VVATKTFRVVQVRWIAIALAVMAVLLLGALSLSAISGGQTSSAAQSSSAKAFPYGPADGHQDPAPAERTQSHGPR